MVEGELLTELCGEKFWCGDSRGWFGSLFI